MDTQILTKITEKMLQRGYDNETLEEKEKSFIDALSKNNNYFSAFPSYILDTTDDNSALEESVKNLIAEYIKRNGSSALLESFNRKVSGQNNNSNKSRLIDFSKLNDDAITYHVNKNEKRIAAAKAEFGLSDADVDYLRNLVTTERYDSIANYDINYFKYQEISKTIDSIDSFHDMSFNDICDMFGKTINIGLVVAIWKRYDIDICDIAKCIKNTSQSNV